MLLGEAALDRLLPAYVLGNGRKANAPVNGPVWCDLYSTVEPAKAMYYKYRHSSRSRIEVVRS